MFQGGKKALWPFCRGWVIAGTRAWLVWDIEGDRLHQHVSSGRGENDRAHVGWKGKRGLIPGRSTSQLG